MGFSGSVEMKDKSRLPAAMAAGVVVVVLIVGGLMLVTRYVARHSPPPAAQHFPFGPQEQEYSQHIHFTNIQMAHAENFLNEDFTYVAGTIDNGGVRALHGLEVTIEFHDPFNQVILRESRQLIGPQAPPLAAGQHQDFQVTLQHLPDTWNHQYPSIRVTGLALE
ncbi:MAG: hypothetical protein ACRD4S_14635 [Candidatus Acidiferrales bacterium]